MSLLDDTTVLLALCMQMLIWQIFFFFIYFFPLITKLAKITSRSLLSTSRIRKTSSLSYLRHELTVLLSDKIWSAGSWSILQNPPEQHADMLLTWRAGGNTYPRYRSKAYVCQRVGDKPWEKSKAFSPVEFLGLQKSGKFDISSLK